MRFHYVFPVLIVSGMATSAFAQSPNAYATDPAYRHSDSHAGGPADDLIPRGVPAPVVRRVRDPAYRYSGTHAGGPADDLIAESTPAPVVLKPTDPAYRYSGSHAGGPANDLARE